MRPTADNCHSFNTQTFLADPYITTDSIPCDIELVLYREQHGFLDENFSGGSIISAYAQRVRLRYLPVTVNTQ